MHIQLVLGNKLIAFTLIVIGKNDSVLEQFGFRTDYGQEPRLL